MTLLYLDIIANNTLRSMADYQLILKTTSTILTTIKKFDHVIFFSLITLWEISYGVWFVKIKNYFFSITH